MKNHLLEWLPANQGMAALISIGLNIIIAIIGVLPSAFITAGTVGILGFKIGLIILIFGEAAGAILSFFLYRKGLLKLSKHPKIKKMENKFLYRLKNTRGVTAFLMVILLRLLPFVPSGAVTLTAALSKMGLVAFSLASTLGKIPALFFEAYTISNVLKLKIEWQIGFIIFFAVLFLINLVWKRNKEAPSQKS